jgi:threonine/homoserine/homoserine lactone efflux protein
METEKILCMAAMIIAGLLTFIFLLDAGLGFPFNRASMALDIMFVLGGAFVLWQGYDAYREMA